MQDANRDLLVLSRMAHLSQEELDYQVQLLNTILYHTETWAVFCTANEIIDINRHRIIQKPHLIQNILSNKRVKPFVFTSNKN